MKSVNKVFVVVLLLLAVLVVGCGDKKTAARIDELQAKNEALEKRVRSLEDQLLDTQKKMIAQEQALQTVNSRIRDMENYFNKMQVSTAPMH